MANWLGYVDDSGSGEGRDRGNIFLLAGFVACARQWKRFSTKWEKTCNREPKTPDFKMQTANRLFRADGTPIWTRSKETGGFEILCVSPRELHSFALKA
jgi:hypothetical protein